MEGRGPDAGWTVLLVEDQDAVRQLLRMVLTRAGYRVLVAAAGEEAVRTCTANSGPIHLLVTDINLPGIKGPELARELQRSRPGLKVLYLSGNGTDACGPGSFLQKPFQMDVLIQKVRDLLAGVPAADPAPAHA